MAEFCSECNFEMDMCKKCHEQSACDDCDDCDDGICTSCYFRMDCDDEDDQAGIAEGYTPAQIERAFKQAEADQRFRFGAYKGPRYEFLNWKQFIAEMYERMSGEKVFEEEAKP